MNMKVVAVWAIFIAIFAGLGIFGYMNQDFLVDDTRDIYIPEVNANNAYSCSADVENGTVIYTFASDDSNNLRSVQIRYINKVQNLEELTDAENLNNGLSGNPVNGIKIIHNEDNYLFDTTLSVTENSYDTTALSYYDKELQTLHMYTGKYSTYEDYRDFLTSKFPGLTCNKTGNTQESTTTTVVTTSEVAQ